MNMSAEELPDWLNQEEPAGAGYSKGDSSSETMKHNSARKIIATLDKNSKMSAGMTRMTLPTCARSLCATRGTRHKMLRRDRIPITRVKRVWRTGAMMLRKLRRVYVRGTMCTYIIK